MSDSNLILILTNPDMIDLGTLVCIVGLNVQVCLKKIERN